MDTREVRELDERSEKEFCVSALDYGVLIVEMVHRFKNKKLLKRIYELAEYLYLYEDSE